MKRRTRWAVWIVLAALPLLRSGVSEASLPTVGECLEASDFIANAARSRDFGMPRDDFLVRLDADFDAIKAYPPSLRWFVQDEDDQQFLQAQVRDVFDAPETPEHHRVLFLEACFARMTT